MVAILEMKIPVKGLATMLCYGCSHDFGWDPYYGHGGRDIPTLCGACVLDHGVLHMYTNQMKVIQDANPLWCR